MLAADFGLIDRSAPANDRAQRNRSPLRMEKNGPAVSRPYRLQAVMPSVLDARCHEVSSSNHPDDVEGPVDATRPPANLPSRFPFANQDHDPWPRLDSLALRGPGDRRPFVIPQGTGAHDP